MKKVTGIIFAAAALVLPVFSAKAAGTGTLEMAFTASTVYTYSDEFTAVFTETETGETYTVETGYEWTEGDVSVSFPEGTWELEYVQLDGEGVYGMYYYTGPETFTVTAGETTEITVHMEQHYTSLQSMEVDLDVANDSSFSGTVQIWLEGHADAYYADTYGYISDDTYVTYIHVQESYQLRYDGLPDWTEIIDAGEYEITEIRAYDADGNPMSAVYDPTVKVSRTDGDPVIEVYLYAEGEEYDVPSGMDARDFSDMPEKETVGYVKTVETLADYLGVEEEEAEADLEGFGEVLEAAITYYEEEGGGEALETYMAEQEGAGTEEEETETVSGTTEEDTSGMALKIVLAIVIPLCVLGYAGYRWWKSYKKRQKEQEENGER